MRLCATRTSRRTADGRRVGLGLLTSLATTVLATVLSTPAVAAPGDLEWEQRGSGLRGMATSMALDPASGDLLLALDGMADPDALVRVDGATGHVEWEQRLSAPTNLNRLRFDSTRERIIAAGTEYDGDQRLPFVESRDALGEVVWRRDLTSWTRLFYFDDLTVDPVTGQICVHGSGTIGSHRWSSILTCLTPGGALVVSDTYPSASRLTSSKSMALDERTHRLFVSSYDGPKQARSTLTAYSPQGEVLWRRRAARGVHVHDVLVDARRGLVHVVATDPRAGRALLLRYDTEGRVRSSTAWLTDRWFVPRATALTPGSGRVLVAGFSGHELVAWTLASSGRRVSAMRVPNARGNPHVAADRLNGGVVLSANHRGRIHTTAYTANGRVRWRTTRPEDGYVPAGVVDAVRGRYVALMSSLSLRMVAFRN